MEQLLTTILELRDRLIKDGIASVKKLEKRPERVRGGVAGFELCRTLETPKDFQRVLSERHDVEVGMIAEGAKRIDTEVYWEHRYATIQVEFVYERLKVAWHMSPLSAMAVLHYARLVGIKGKEREHNLGRVL